MVSIVFMLAVANEKGNPARKVIRQIASISEEPELVRGLTKVKNKSELLHLLVK
ncbi:PTS sugar transporter subunit IIA [Virgibacillus profundi]|uniref:PTS sugar transporter subunit IIA n=1 Tax=Virgibacillus profundi TaxID=2024555 RepID=UPI000D1C8087|nr:PTS sugar transporter subunit IIA [Virgibacillus profundi]